MERIYVDHCATTPVDAEVMGEMMRFFGNYYGNPASGHTFGREAKQAIEVARLRVAELIGASPQEIIFTSGGTEADNLAILGVAQAAPKEKRHLVISAVEHPAVMNACRFLERFDYRVTLVPVDKDGVIDLKYLEEVLSEDTCLVSIIHGQNETGVVNPLRSVCILAHTRGIPVHTDAVQSVGKIPFDVQDTPVDLLSIAAHKIYGPKGAGALYVRAGTPLLPITFGGGQELGLRNGTENVPGIVGLGSACRKAKRDLAQFIQRTTRLRILLEEGIMNAFPQAIINGQSASRLPHVSSVSFPGISGHKLMQEMDRAGIAISAGAACHTGEERPSYVLKAMGMPDEYALGTVRFSFGWMNEETDVTRILEALGRVVKKSLDK
ncbi:MAG: cysteine desulfurase [Syntrophales bacterium]|nr:cysteine desulfurase [Syntrophales bacterium]